MLTIKTNRCAFSLVELIISVGIAGLLMLGMSLFFSNTLKSSFEVRDKTVATREQFVINAIVSEKFAAIEEILEEGGTHIITKNNIDGKGAPFSYMGKKKEPNNVGRLVFKDWFPFNKVVSLNGITVFGDGGAGEIKDMTNRSVVRQLPLNFGGFTSVNNQYYIALPEENKILKCRSGQLNCNGTALNLKQGSMPYALSGPTDIATNGTDIFISDTGNNRIIKVVNDEAVTILAGGLNYPTGLAYYEDENDRGHPYLFVADTLNNQVKRIDLLRNPTITTVAGKKGSTACHNSAITCELKRPTGLSVYKDIGFLELYIADSGHHRIVRVTDVGKPITAELNFIINARGSLKKISVYFSGGIRAEAATLTQPIESSDNSIKNGSFFTTQNTLEYQLFTEIAEDTTLTNACGEGPCPQSKVKPKNITMFPAGSFDISIQGDNYTATKGRGYLNVIPEITAFTGGYSAGTPIHWQNSVPARTTIGMKIRDLNTTIATETYPLIKIEGFDVNNLLKFTAYQSLRVGDGILGTPDDIVKVVAEGKNITKLNGESKVIAVDIAYPTGGNHEGFANTGKETFIKRNIDGENRLTLFDATTIEPVSYKSDFELIDETDASGIKGVKFEKRNNDTILKMSLNAKIGEKEDGSTEVQKYELNTGLSQKKNQ